MRLPSRALGVIRYEKVSPFVKSEIILPLLCFLLDPLTNKHYRKRSSMINLWRDSRTCQILSRILLSIRQRSNNYLEISKENFWGNIMLSHWPYFAWKFFMICFHKILLLRLSYCSLVLFSVKFFLNRKRSLTVSYVRLCVAFSLINFPRNIEENYLTWQFSWKFSYNLRTKILKNMCKKFC